MWQNDYQYYATLSTTLGDQIAEVQLDIDWIPALRWAEFEHLQKGATIACSTLPVIEPIWEPESTPPFIAGAMIYHGADRIEGSRFPLGYFSAAISSASSQLIGSGGLSPGQPFSYQIYALADKQPRGAADTGVDIVAVEEMPSIEQADLASLLASAETDVGIDSGSDLTGLPSVDGAMPVLVSRSVLGEARDLGQSSGDVETGGILLGKLLRDGDGTLFSRVTAQIPAEHTRATRGSLGFTPATWASVDAAISLRAGDEAVLGWWHSHPFFCRQCTPANRAVCSLAAPMFSAADRALHREIFQKPWSIGLLLSFLGQAQPRYNLFAWNHGQIEDVNFSILPETASINGEHP